MRSLWKGFISFGLVNIPVRLYVATEKKDLKFRYLHQECMTPVQYQKRCPTCNKDLENEQIVYGYEYQKGRFVILSEEDFARIPLESTRSVDILNFVDLKQVDPLYFDKSYYLEPGDGGTKAYALLMQAMESSGKVAIARVVIRTKEALAAVRVKDKALVMETMFYPDEVRSSAGLALPADDVKVHENETKMAVSLIESLSTEFNPTQYQNRYRQALHEMIDAKIAGQEIEVSPQTPTTNVVDLMDALKQSVKLAEKERKKARPKKVKVGT
jgi:DNA end-binding protein Ku